MIATQPCTQHLQKYTVREEKKKGGGRGLGGQRRRFIPRKYSDHYLKPGHKHLPSFYMHTSMQRDVFKDAFKDVSHVKGIRFKIRFLHILGKTLV